MTDALATARASSLSSVLILLDLSAAFDTVNHQLLTSSLAELDISGTALSCPHCYADDTQRFLSFTPSATQINKKISACLADISSWMARYHQKLNLDKTELLYIPHRTSPLPELSVHVDGTTVTASRSARNLGVVLDDQLEFKEQVVTTTRSCRFLLYNIRRIQSYLTTYSTQLLVEAMVISRLDYCNSLLASLPACVIQLLQLIQNAVAHLVFNLPKCSHVTPLLR